MVLRETIKFIILFYHKIDTNRHCIAIPDNSSSFLFHFLDYLILEVNDFLNALLYKFYLKQFQTKNKALTKYTSKHTVGSLSYIINSIIIIKIFWFDQNHMTKKHMAYKLFYQ